MSFSNVNYLSILVAAVAAWIFGGIYYSTLSRQWVAAQGKTAENCKVEMAGKSAPAKVAPFIVVFVSEFIIAWMLYGILFHLNMYTLRGGVITALFCWFGFVLTTIATNNAFQSRRVSLTVLDGIAWLGAFVIMGAIVGWWGH
ncbi:MAG TPA: DUF1761 domain-containing protein [Pseudolabrys sp.]|nr:DUF1761 domain-containing protein [Pseudolabrys sp.]